MAEETPPAPSNDATPPAPKEEPKGNASDPAEVEALRKEKQQAEMRAKQLENQLADKNKAEEEAKAKELEEKEQFKTLYEESEAKRKALEAENTQAAKKAELKSEADKLLGEYQPEVRKLAEEVGLSLTDTDQASLDAFKERLDKLSAPFGGKQKKVAPNNPSVEVPTGPKIENADGIIEKPLDKDPAKFDELARSMPGIASMMNPPSES